MQVGLADALHCMLSSAAFVDPCNMPCTRTHPWLKPVSERLHTCLDVVRAADSRTTLLLRLCMTLVAPLTFVQGQREYIQRMLACIGRSTSKQNIA